jgi:sugar phosphate isomerase/epimerase
MYCRPPGIGIGSFAFRYAIGSGDFHPPNPMTVLDFLSEAHCLGFGGVQLCENLGFSDFGDDKLLAIKEKAQELGLFIELGMRHLTWENISRHLKMAELLSARFLRIVLGSKKPFPEHSPEALQAQAVRILREALPSCRERDVTIGIENHFDLPSKYLVRIIEEIDDRRVGLILDTTNCFGFIERPEATLQAFRPYLLSIHLKDFIIRKVEAGFLMTGTVLGEGWLDVENILKSALNSNPNLSIIMEMTIRRDSEQTMEETLVWEKRAIQKSIDYLRQTLMSLSAGDEEAL